LPQKSEFSTGQRSAEKELFDTWFGSWHPCFQEGEKMEKAHSLRRFLVIRAEIFGFVFLMALLAGLCVGCGEQQVTVGSTVTKISSGTVSCAEPVWMTGRGELPQLEVEGSIDYSSFCSASGLWAEAGITNETECSMIFLGEETNMPAWGGFYVAPTSSTDSTLRIVAGDETISWYQGALHSPTDDLCSGNSFAGWAYLCSKPDCAELCNSQSAKRKLTGIEAYLGSTCL
jgi:hypothetical protein